MISSVQLFYTIILFHVWQNFINSLKIFKKHFLYSELFLYTVDMPTTFLTTTFKQHSRYQVSTEPDKAHDPEEQFPFQTLKVGRVGYRDEDHSGHILVQRSSHCTADPTFSSPEHSNATSYRQ